MRVLVIEDNAKIASTLRQGLSEAGHSVDVCLTGSDGKRAAVESTFDTIILDVGLPDCSGMDVCKHLRESGIRTPVLMLTVYNSTGDKVRGLTAGADDYLTKPFEFEELVARLDALARRARNAESSTIRFEDLELDLYRRCVTRGEHTITLTRREFELLELFMRHPHRVFSREAIATSVWRQHFAPESNVIDVHVYSLRRKINSKASKPLIRTVIGYGYILAGESTDGS